MAWLLVENDSEVPTTDEEFDKLLVKAVSLDNIVPGGGGPNMTVDPDSHHHKGLFLFIEF